MGGFTKEIELNSGDPTTAEARSAELFDQLGRRNRLAIRLMAITLKTDQKNRLLNVAPQERTNDILWEINSAITTKILVNKLSWRDLKPMRNISSGMIRINCFNCALVWLERLDRVCGMLENNRRQVESSPC